MAGCTSGSRVADLQQETRPLILWMICNTPCECRRRTAASCLFVKHEFPIPHVLLCRVSRMVSVGFVSGVRGGSVRNVHKVAFAAAALTTLALAPAAWAQDASPARTYTPADFAAFTPRTAFDLLQRVPGFSIAGGDDARGLGQASVNVLINGARISAKGQSAEDVLRRTAASAVERIDIYDAAALGIPGLSGEVADIRVTAATTTTSWELSPIFRQELAASFASGRLSRQGSLRGAPYSISIENESARRGNNGRETVRDGAGVLLEQREENFQFYEDAPTLSASIEFKPTPTVDLNLNLTGTVFHVELDETRHTDFLDGTAGVRIFDERVEGTEGELGGDVSLPLLTGRLKLIGVYSRADEDVFSRVRVNAETRPFVHDVFLAQNDFGERIGRAEWTKANMFGGTVEIAAEGAFNYLEAVSKTRALDASGGILSERPVDAARVEEKRAEASVTYSRALTPKLDAQFSLGGEISTLSLPGTDEPDRTFSRPKGYVNLTRKFGEKMLLRARIERSVGQLDFGDFVSNVNLNQETNNVGNRAIVPDQTLSFSLEGERRWGTKSVLRINVYSDQITDLVDALPVDTDDDGFVDADSPGNLPDASATGLEIEATLGTDGWGLKGGELGIEYEVRETRLDDPVTGETRAFNNDTQHFWEAFFQHDVPNTAFAWGFRVEDERGTPNVRLTEIFRERRDPIVFAFVENRDVFGTTLRISVGNITNQHELATRTVFDAPRDRGDVRFVEDRDRTFGPILRIRWSGQF